MFLDSNKLLVVSPKTRNASVQYPLQSLSYYPKTKTLTTNRVVAYLPMRGTIFRSVGFNAFQDFHLTWFFMFLK
tara:strand:+ start:487 stop:708 length:222 start_codon:yes stop_codon:yes gene_type:complete